MEGGAWGEGERASFKHNDVAANSKRKKATVGRSKRRLSRLVFRFAVDSFCPSAYEGIPVRERTASQSTSLSNDVNEHLGVVLARHRRLHDGA